MITLIASVETLQGIYARYKYLKREDAVDLFGNFESFFQFAKHSKAVRKKKHKLYTVVLSFDDANLTASRLREITLSWLKLFLTGYRLEEISFSGVVHLDTEHLHVHLSIANAFLPTGSYIYFYHHGTDFVFLNQLNRYIERRYSLKSPLDSLKPISYPAVYLSKLRKGKPDVAVERLVRLVNSLNSSIEAGYLKTLKEVLETLRAEKGVQLIYHRTYKDIFGEVALKFEGDDRIFRIRGLGLHPQYYTSKQDLKKKLTFDEKLFTTALQKRFRKIYRRRKMALKRLKGLYRCQRLKPFPFAVQDFIEKKDYSFDLELEK